MEEEAHIFMPESNHEMDWVREIYKYNTLKKVFFLSILTLIIRNGTSHLFIGIRDINDDTSEQKVIIAMDMSEHVGFRPLTRKSYLTDSLLYLYHLRMLNNLAYIMPITITHLTYSYKLEPKNLTKKGAVL